MEQNVILNVAGAMIFLIDYLLIMRKQHEFRPGPKNYFFHEILKKSLHLGTSYSIIFHRLEDGIMAVRVFVSFY